jgi:hypothetical protein
MILEDEPIRAARHVHLPKAREQVMKTEDEIGASGLFLGSEPLEGGEHERRAASDRDGKDLGHGPKDTSDDDSTDKGADGTDGGDSDGSDGADSDGTDKGHGGADSRDADGRD